MKRVVSETVFVARADLNAPRLQQAALTFDKLPKVTGVPPAKEATGAPKAATDVARSAAQVFRVNEAVREYARGSVAPGPAPRQANPAGAAGERMVRATSPVRSQFLDWNPDVKVARSLGVRIEYSSRANQVRCPELGLSSVDRLRISDGFVPRLTSSGVRSEPASAVISGGSRGSGSGASSGVHATASTTTAASAAGSSSGGGGKIKN
jgi:hypothetical protein